MIRLYLQDTLCAEAILEPSEEQARYLLTVMRLKVDDPLLVFNGRDGEWRAQVSGLSKRGCSLRLQMQTRPQTNPPDFELIIAMVKRPRLESIMEKAVELGVSRVRLLVTQRTNHDRANLSRLSAIAVEAAEQTGRLEIPEIVSPQKLQALLEAWPIERTLMFCDEAGDDPTQMWGGSAGKAAPALRQLLDSKLAEDPRDVGTPRAWAVMIGPEGGFAPDERAWLRSHPGVIAVSLGPRILRADTAAIAAVVLWQAALGDWA